MAAKFDNPSETILDTIVVGAGFSGLQVLYKLRSEGFNVKVYEKAPAIGGVWYWNCYPGARVDFDHQNYQYSNDLIWKTFQWSERFPGQAELRKYFEHVDEVLDLSKDIQFHTTVTGAYFNEGRKQWRVKTDVGHAWARFLILCTGVSAKRYQPAIQGLENFKGDCYHTSEWPQHGVDLKGKRVAVIGTGASGIQVTQTIAPEVAHLTVYQRTPNMALPMQQYSAKDNNIWQKQSQREVFQLQRQLLFGSNDALVNRNALDSTPEERRELYEKLYQHGGMALGLATFQDFLTNKEANDLTYAFWCEKTRARIHDPVKKDILAPIVAPHVFGAKRLSLESTYYEVFNQENVDLIDLKKSPITRITETGIETNMGLVEIDVIIWATGFDAITGGLLSIPISNGQGMALQDKWKNGTLTNLGMAVAGFPNMLMIYGPHAPLGFAVAPVSIEVQVDWITELLSKMRSEQKDTVETTAEAEEAWSKLVNFIWSSSLFTEADSWYQGANIPGKRREALCFLGGFPNYIQALEDCKASGFTGFEFV